MTSWIAGVTTAPRKQPTVKTTVKSLQLAGWDPILFAEPNSVQVPNIETFTNPVRLGLWNNWLNAARYCVESKADVILLAQDDIIIHPGAKRFVESILWPSKKIGFLSLYTPAHYSKKQPEGIIISRPVTLWGSCCMVWPREILKRVIEHPVAINWYGPNPSRTERIKMAKYPFLIKNSDTAIGKVIYAMNRKMMHVNPSLCQHIGDTSTVSDKPNKGNRQAANLVDFSKPLSYPPIAKYELII